MHMMTDQAVLRALGGRLARYRLNRDLTQLALAEQAGVSRPTVARVEGGQSTTTTNLVRILRALDLLGNVDALVPAPPPSPMQQLATGGRLRTRASGKGGGERRGPWRWGEES